MKIIVVDASVAAKWLIPEELSKESLAVLEEGNRLHIPDYLLIEMDSLFCKWVRRRIVTPAEAVKFRESLHQYPLRRHSFMPLLDPAFALAIETQTSPYDCLYLALAILLRGTLLTADKIFYDRILETSYEKRIHWIGLV